MPLLSFMSKQADFMFCNYDISTDSYNRLNLRMICIKREEKKLYGKVTENDTFRHGEKVKNEKPL